MNTNFDRRKSLQELEQDDWEQPEYTSHLVQTCYRLWHVPLEYFETEDLRIMIGQQFSLPFLVPLALEKLEENPLAEGDYYPGDLLKVVLQIPEEFWGAQPDMRNALRRIVVKAKELLASAEDDDTRTIRESLAEALDAWHE
jgi:CDI immunity proteins